MKKLLSLVVGLAVVGIPSVAFADPQPTDCTISNHCYANAYDWSQNGNSIDAIGADFWTECLHLDNNTVGLTTLQQWVTFAPTAGWIESGFIVGYVAGGDPGGPGFRTFWGEHNGTTYYTHSTTGSTNTWTNLSMYKQSNGTWKFYKAGTEIGSGVFALGNGSQPSWGNETTEENVSSHTRIKNATHHETSGSWVGPNWVANDPSEDFGVYTNISSSNALENWSLRQLCTLVAKPSKTHPDGSPVTLLAKAVPMPTTSPTGAPSLVAPKVELPVRPPNEIVVVKSAKEFAAANGEKSPVIKLVKAKRSAAQTLLTGKNPNLEDGDSYVVEMKGKFVANLMPHPEGYKAPTGNVLTLTYDAKTGVLTDTALTTTVKDMSSLGTVKSVS